MDLVAITVIFQCILGLLALQGLVLAVFFTQLQFLRLYGFFTLSLSLFLLGKFHLQTSSLGYFFWVFAVIPNIFLGLLWSEIKGTQLAVKPYLRLGLFSIFVGLVVLNTRIYQSIPAILSLLSTTILVLDCLTQSTDHIKFKIRRPHLLLQIIGIVYLVAMITWPILEIISFQSHPTISYIVWVCSIFSLGMMLPFLGLYYGNSIYQHKLEESLDNQNDYIEDTNVRVRHILENLDSGILILNKDLTIDKELSMTQANLNLKLRSLGIQSELGFSTISDNDGIELVFENSLISAQTKKTARVVLDLSSEFGLLTYQLNDHHLPIEIQKKANLSTKSYHIKWDAKTLAKDPDQIDIYIVQIEDKTRLLKVDYELQYHQDELVIFKESQKVSPFHLQEFHTKVQKLLQQNKTTILNFEPRQYIETINRIQINLINILSFSKYLGLSYAIQTLQKTITTLDKLKTRSMNSVRPEDLLQEMISLQQNMKRYNQKENVISATNKTPAVQKFIDYWRFIETHHPKNTLEEEHVGKLKQLFQATEVIDFNHLISEFDPMQEVLCPILQKQKVKIRITGGETKIIQEAAPAIQNILLKCFCNALIFGIETEDDRKKSGKSSNGHIDLAICVFKDTVEIVVRHDGVGLPTDLFEENRIQTIEPTSETLASLFDHEDKNILKGFMKLDKKMLIFGIYELTNICGGDIVINVDPTKSHHHSNTPFEWALHFPTRILRK